MHIGYKSNMLTVISKKYKVKKNNRNVSYVKCKCECGTIKEIRADYVKHKKQISCGCYQRKIASKTHKKYDEKPSSYSSWSAMKQRCTNTKNQEYKNYGGRNIKYDPKWETFEGFYKDMGEKPKNKSLERINVDLDYTKENCVWATTIEQGRNKRNSQANVNKKKLREIISDLPYMSYKDISSKHDTNPSLVSSINFAWSNLETIKEIEKEIQND